MPVSVHYSCVSWYAKFIPLKCCRLNFVFLLYFFFICFLHLTCSDLRADQRFQFPRVSFDFICSLNSWLGYNLSLLRILGTVCYCPAFQARPFMFSLSIGVGGQSLEHFRQWSVTEPRLYSTIVLTFIFISSVWWEPYWRSEDNCGDGSFPCGFQDWTQVPAELFANSTRLYAKCRCSGAHLAGFFLSTAITHITHTHMHTHTHAHTHAHMHTYKRLRRGKGQCCIECLGTENILWG